MRVAIETHGCRLNQADGDALARALQEQGHELVGEVEDAELLVLNTCTITHRADADARHVVRHAARRRPGLRVIVTGCYADAAPAELASLPGVEAVVGNAAKLALPARLEHAAGLVPAQRLTRRRPFEDLPVASSPRRSRAYLKVQDGCNYRCAFCIVPSVRGRSRSRPLDEVRREARAIVAGGRAELVLTGIHLGTWGWDLGLRPGLGALVGAVLDELPERPGVGETRRVRLGSIDPQEVDDALMARMAGDPRLCPFLHMPVQSGDAGVLRRMRRPHGDEALPRLLPRLRSVVPEVACGSDLLVGFPGESEAAFEATLALLDPGGLDYAHVFPFSRRRGTEAAEMPDCVSEPVKQRRAAALREASAARWLEFRQRRLGRELEAVVHLQRRRDGALVGLTAEGIRVELEGPDGLLGRAVPVRLARLEGGRSLATVG